MRVLMVSLDRKAFVPGDPARERLASYGEVFSELHIIVYSTKAHGFAKEQIRDNVWLYPTNSVSRAFYIPDAVRTARTLSVDIVSGQDLAETGIAAYVIARRKKVPLQLQDHADVFDPYYAQESAENRIRVLIAKLLLPKAACIRTVLPAGKERIAAQFPQLRERITVLPVYTPVSLFSEGAPVFSVHDRYPQFKTIFLMASRLVPQKDIGFALRAFSEARIPESGLIIVGEGPLKESIQEEIVSLGIEEQVVLVPWERDLVSYYKTADVFVLSSLYESYCRTLVEATAAGLPFVSTDVGVASMLVAGGAQGIVVSRGDHVGFKDALRTQATTGKIDAQKALESIAALAGKDEQEYRARYRASLSCAL